MDRGAWQAAVHRVTESDMTEATQHARSSGSLTPRTGSPPSSEPASHALSVLVFLVSPSLHLSILELTSSWANGPDIKI